MLSSWIEIFVLVTALSIDAFVASFVYGSNKVRIPLTSVGIIAGLSAGILFIFLALGNALGTWIPPALTKGICFALLFILGIIKLLDSSLKSLIRKYKIKQKKLSFSVSELHFILTVYADPEKANVEDEGVLSAGEAVSLGIALSLDSAAAGIGAGMMVSHCAATVMLSFLIGAAAILGGGWLGNLLAKHSSLDLSWLSSLLLIILAFMKLL